MAPRTMILALALLHFAANALAQQDGPTDQPGLLAGPQVDTPPTLVRYGFNGRLERLETRPEVAAALLLAGQRGIDPNTSAEVARVATQRDADLRELMVDRLDDIAAISDLVQAGEDEAARDHMRTLWRQFDRAMPHAPMLEDLGKALGPDLAPRLRRMVDDYWAALLAERMGDRLYRRLGIDPPEPQGQMMQGNVEEEPTDQDTMAANSGAPPIDPDLVMQSDDPVITAALDRLAFQMFQNEIRRAYDLTLARYRELLESINQAIEPSETQRVAIRSIVLEHIKDTRLEATPAERRQTMLAIYRQLDESQRERLYDLLLRQVVPD